MTTYKKLTYDSNKVQVESAIRDGNGAKIDTNYLKISVASSTYAPLASPALTGTPTAPTAANGTNSTQIATTAFVQNAFSANDAMVFKGTLGTGGTVTSLPATHYQGWTYKVITAGTYAGKVCEVGDMVICVTDGTVSADGDWTVVQTNIDGAVTGPASSTAGNIATFNGASGKVIQDSGFTIAKSVPADAKFTDTTYSAASGGGLSLSGTAFSVKTDYQASGKNYAVVKDSSGNLYVNVPWTDNNTEYSAGTGISLSGTTINHSNSVTADTTGVGSATQIPIIKYDGQGHISATPTTATVYPPTTAGTAGQVWTSQGSGVGQWMTLDTTPTASSTKPVTSGGVKTALDEKVTATTHPGQGIYLYGNTNSQVQIPCQTEPNQYTVAYRASGGTIRIGTPTSDDHATTKAYVDTGLAGKQDVFTLTDVNILESD